MLVDVSAQVYRKHFSSDPHMFISEKFIDLVEDKCDKVVRLMKEDECSMGLILGIKDGIARSPFSAPFGGFHYSYEYMFYHVVSDFLSDLKEYIAGEGLEQLWITLPPDLYQTSMNAKFVNAFVTHGFTMETPDITNWANLKHFDGKWTKNVVAQNCRKAIRHGLTCSIVTDRDSMEEAYKVIYRNRTEKGRKLKMSLDDILEVSRIIPVDFFIIRDSDGNCIGTGVFYRGHEKIVECIFLGDDMEHRSLGIMNLLYQNCYEYYKEMGFEYIDLGASSLEGEANDGLIRFKELHNSISSLRYTFSWMPRQV